MKQSSSSNTALEGLRVLDLCSLATQYCGKMLAQLGADVVLVEPPLGSGTRRNGPFLHDTPHPEKSLVFSNFNQGKRSICLDLEQAEAQALLKQLIERTDILIDDSPPGWLESRGLGYTELSAINPALIMTRISPFGQTGPYAGFEADDLVAQAMGGLLYLGGYPDTEPMAPYGHQAYLAAAQFAAVGTMIALWECEATSAKGQLVDVSMQECVSMALENAVQFVDLEETIRKRNGGQQRQAGTGVFECADGLIYLMAGGIAGNRFWGVTAKWLIEVGAPGADALNGDEWQDTAYQASDDAKARFDSIFLPYAKTQTKADLYAEGQRRRIPVCPVSTSQDLLSNPQLRYRQFFQETPHPYSGTTLTLPGAPYRLSATPWQAGRPAPRLGEHTAEVLLTLGVAANEQEALLRNGVTG